MSFWIAVIGLPFVAGVQSFAVDYGYRGFPKSHAIHNAFRVGEIFAVFSLTLALAKVFAP